MGPLLGILRIRHHHLFAAAILSRGKWVYELQFVLSRHKLLVPGRIRILFDRRALLRLRSNTWPAVNS